jgi:hypothetical protein
MTCRACGTTVPDDTETGYVGDARCADCLDNDADAEAFDATAYFEHLADDDAFEAAREREVFGE